jgi:hypothetical protein
MRNWYSSVLYSSARFGLAFAGVSAMGDADAVA